MRTSVNIVRDSHAADTHPKVARSSLRIGDLFMATKDRDARVFMHTGCRTAPPSNRSVHYVIGNTEGSVNLYEPQGTQGDKDIVGWQSMVVTGAVASGEDGAMFTTNGTRMVYLIGTAEIVLDR